MWGPPILQEETAQGRPDQRAPSQNGSSTVCIHHTRRVVLPRCRLMLARPNSNHIRHPERFGSHPSERRARNHSRWRTARAPRHWHGQRQCLRRQCVAEDLAEGRRRSGERRQGFALVRVGKHLLKFDETPMDRHPLSQVLPLLSPGPDLVEDAPDGVLRLGEVAVRETHLRVGGDQTRRN